MNCVQYFEETSIHCTLLYKYGAVDLLRHESDLASGFIQYFFCHYNYRCTADLETVGYYFFKNI
jgi:hypothetical protein